MNSHNLKALNGISQHELFSASQKSAIDDLPIPNELTFLAAGEFDTKSIKTDSDVWRYRYSGKAHALTTHRTSCPYRNKLVKFISSQYVVDKLPTKMYNVANDIYHLFVWFEDHQLQFSKKNLVDLLDCGKWNQFPSKDQQFYSVVFMLRTLSKYDFPSIGGDIEDDLVLIARPHNDSFLIYQETDNVISNETITLILNGLWDMSKSFDEGGFFETSHLMDASILGLEYVTGARPVQLDKLIASDLSVDTLVKKGEIGRYSIAIPYAKTGELSSDVERISIALPYEIANLLRAYVKQEQLEPNDKLFPTWNDTSGGIKKALNRQILRFSPKEYQELVRKDKTAVRLFTPSEFRHNVGHSLAMQGASAAEIAFVLGHSSLVVAKHYILATPELARVRYRALGVNATWQNMMALMVTGDLVYTEDWRGIKVAGIVGSQLHTNCGGCGRISKECPFAEIRACYGCLYFRPFIDGEHEQVLLGVQKEITEAVALSNAVGDARNPAVEILTRIKENIMLVMKRVENHPPRPKQSIDAVPSSNNLPATSPETIVNSGQGKLL
ncbi:tyrosine-type recombinase/integrase [Vibrio tasmaniensis]|uniref:tyrosine-type recombinase/integrase n=1 Tax=Vibrio tasmaniensis TaxID=212663 RepID=UPI00107FA978|nr:tyrosine-type recombinase/integrase [Vibrio tasmaniensis]